jgi:hypothetical protein
MEEKFVSYNQALRLKALGFDEPCFKCKVIGQEHLDYTPSDYDDFPEQKEVEVLIPTFSQAFRWFREKYGLFIQPNRTIDSEGIWFYFSVSSKRTDVCECSFSYEEAELACLTKLIEIVETKSE